VSKKPKPKLRDVILLELQTRGSEGWEEVACVPPGKSFEADRYILIYPGDKVRLRLARRPEGAARK